MVDPTKGARARFDDVVSFFRTLPWRFTGATGDPVLRARLKTTFDALIRSGAIEWRSASTLPAGEYDQVPLREDQDARFTALLPTHAPGLAETFYVLRERAIEQRHIDGPFPIGRLLPQLADPFAPSPVNVAAGFAFASEPSSIAVGAGRSERGSVFGTLLGLNPPSSGAPLAAFA